MTMQLVVVAFVVAACAVYAAWALMPAALRRPLAAALLRLPLPVPLARGLRRAAQGGGACGCEGCDAKPVSAAPGPRVIRIHRR
jgi:hypothetical protein